MGDTKIFVVQLKEIVKLAIYAIIGIAIIALLVYFFMPKKNGTEPQPRQQQQSHAAYVPGTYSIELLLANSPVNVDVTVSENEILAVRLKDTADMQEAFYPLLNPTMEVLSAEIVRYQTPEIVNASEYDVTNKVLLDAVKMALATAADSSAAR